MENLKQKLLDAIDGEDQISQELRDGIEAIPVKDICFECHSFNFRAAGSYRCAVSGSCIGVELPAEMKSYLLWKLGVLTQEEYLKGR